MKHTPGPWGCIDTSNHAHDYRLTKPDGSTLPLHVEANDHSEQRANARLIAAAPDLLTELHKARAALQESLDELIKSHTHPSTGLITDDADLLAIESDQDLINSIDAAIAKATGEQP
jgi:methionine synthase I (cobalamin-dependent)